MSGESARRSALPDPWASPARRSQSRTPLTPAERAARIERRRRLAHFRRRRRDLLEDFGMAIVVMILALILTPGLGVVALMATPVAFALLGTLVAERTIRKRRRRSAPPSTSAGGARAQGRPSAPGRRPASRRRSAER